MTDGFLATPDGEALGTAPRLGDRRFWHLCLLGLTCIVTIGLRINTAKMAVVYDPQTGRASDAVTFPKPLFLATTYFLGKILILPFVGWQPSQWPLQVYWKIFVMVVFGAVGGMLEYASVLYLPVSVVAMLRVAGLVFFTGFASAYVTQRSPMTWGIAGGLTIVVAGAVVTSVYHVGTEEFSDGALLGLCFVFLSTVSDALEQVVCEVILQEETVDVDGIAGTVGDGIALLFDQSALFLQTIERFLGLCISICRMRICICGHIYFRPHNMQKAIGIAIANGTRFCCRKHIIRWRSNSSSLKIRSCSFRFKPTNSYINISAINSDTKYITNTFFL